ncbi:hypothetical protein G7072_15495 [Nocardioides sp. HDW12B]|uniref:hypothetical protein n=1 Tax=Nocardioides sp. HDW12B TaxID=2714939 RepID=UPI001409B670|nr:hypothetical protein [Nocardioides sp. HDW12B]QIK67567.1 hypothetical protein G7072_15495 [Nocardioides sp. HDW12B]
MGELISAVLVFGTAAAAWTVVLRGTERIWFPRTLRRADRLLLRLGLRSPAPEPTGRPLEVVAADVRRLARRFRCPAEGARFAKVEGYRRAYDAVLVEACDVLGVPTLVGVLPPGSELDRERARVEEALDAAGLSVEVWR